MALFTRRARGTSLRAAIGALSVVGLLAACAPDAAPDDAAPPNAIEDISARRFASNPLITPDSSPSIGEFIGGPSVIRVPDWVEAPLGRYYMYFAHHGGDYIRLAYAEDLEGPWTIHEPGVLRLEDVPHFRDHIASPDVHIDADEQRIRMYFHGEVDGVEGGQYTGAAVSSDGLAFEPLDRVLGWYTFRVFEHGGDYYAVSKMPRSSGGRIQHSETPLGVFSKSRPFIARMRRSAVTKRGDDRLLVFYSVIGSSPEGIVASSVDLTGNWRDWRPSAPVDVLMPDMPYEGSEYPDAVSKPGRAVGVKALRDPAIFEEDGRTYLFYSIAGEEGIAGAELDIRMRDDGT